MTSAHRILAIGDESFPLRYTVNSVCCLEERLGKSLHTVLSTDAASVRALLWCALLHYDTHITLEQAGDLLDLALRDGLSLADVGAICADALMDAGFFRPAEGGQAAPCPSAPSISI